MMGFELTAIVNYKNILAFVINCSALFVFDSQVLAPGKMQTKDDSNLGARPAIVQTQISLKSDTQDDPLFGLVGSLQNTETVVFAGVNLSDGETKCVILPNSNRSNNGYEGSGLPIPEVLVNNRPLGFGTGINVSDNIESNILLTNNAKNCQTIINKNLAPANTNDHKINSVANKIGDALGLASGTLKVPWFDEYGRQITKQTPVIFTNISVSSSSSDGQFILVKTDRDKSRTENFNSEIFNGAPVFKSKQELVGYYITSKSEPEDAVSGISVIVSLLNQAREYKNTTLEKFIFNLRPADINGTGLSLAVVKPIIFDGEYKPITKTPAIGKI